jgi:hypothetical protein
MFVQNGPGFLSEGAGNIDAEFRETLDTDRINDVRDTGRKVTRNVVSLEEALDDEGLAVYPGPCDQCGGFVVHHFGQPTTSWKRR